MSSLPLLGQLDAHYAQNSFDFQSFALQK